MRLPTIFGWHEETEQMPEDSTDDYIVASFSQEHKKRTGSPRKLYHEYEQQY